MRPSGCPKARAVARVDPDERAAESGRVAARAQILASQRSALRRRQRLLASHRNRRIAAGVATPLTVVGEFRVGAVAGTGVERAVGAEQRADRVHGSLLAPGLDQHLSAPTIVLPSAVSRERRPLITQPLELSADGSGQPSEVSPGLPQRGAVPKIGASWA